MTLSLVCSRGNLFSAEHSNTTEQFKHKCGNTLFSVNIMRMLSANLFNKPDDFKSQVQWEITLRLKHCGSWAEPINRRKTSDYGKAQEQHCLIKNTDDASLSSQFFLLEMKAQTRTQFHDRKTRASTTWDRSLRHTIFVEVHHVGDS